MRARPRASWSQGPRGGIRTEQSGSKPRSQDTEDSPPPGPVSDRDPTPTFQQKEGPAPRDSVIGPRLPLLQQPGPGGWELVRSVPRAAPGRSATPRAQPIPHPEPLRGAAQHPLQASPRAWGSGPGSSRARWEAREGSVHSALSPAPHCRESVPLYSTFLSGAPGAAQRAPIRVGRSQPGPGQPKVGSRHTEMAQTHESPPLWMELCCWGPPPWWVLRVSVSLSRTLILPCGTPSCGRVRPPPGS